MKKSDLKAVVAELIEVEPADLEPETDLSTIDTFDSVSVLGLIVSLDDQFGIKMSSLDAQNLKHYGDFEKLALSQGIELTD
jgi:acyl carrier protein